MSDLLPYYSFVPASPTTTQDQGRSFITRAGYRSLPAEFRPQDSESSSSQAPGIKKPNSLFSYSPSSLLSYEAALQLLLRISFQD